MAKYTSLSEAIADGVIHYVPFDEVTGNIAEDLVVDGVSSLDLTISNDLGDSSIVPGLFGNCRDFSAQSGGVSGRNADASDLTNHIPFTISFWLKFVFFSGTNNIFMDFNAPSNSVEFNYVNSPNRLRIDYGSSSFSGNDLDDGVWHNIVVKSNGTRLACFDNNSLIGNINGTHPLYPAYDFWQFLSSNSQFLLDDLAVWDRELSDTEVADIYNGGTGDVIVGEPPVNASVGIEIEVYAPTVASVGIEIDVYVGLSVSRTIEINVDQTIRLAKTFVEIQVFENASASTGIEIQVVDSIVAATAGIEFQIYDLHAPSAAIQIDVFSQNDSATSSLWRPGVSVGGTDYSTRVVDSVGITYTEDASAIANFTIVPFDGPVDVFAFVGQGVVINYEELDINGTVTKSIRRFTGVVDKPSYDSDNRKISFSCTNDLQGRISKMSREAIIGVVGGRWSPYIFNENASSWQYFNDVLGTVEASVWIDRSGILRNTSWWATAANYEFTDAHRVYDGITVINPDKGDIINRVVSTIDFRYDRLMQRNVFYDSAYQNGLCHFLEGNTFQLPTRALVERAADSAGWVRMGAVAFKPVWEPTNRAATSTIEGEWQETGTVNCGGETKGWGGDRESEFCLGASFTLSKRWTRSITETYQFVIEAPESIVANGVRLVQEDYGIDATVDRAVWETNYEPLEAVRDIPGNTTTIGLPLVMPPGSEELSNGDWMFPSDSSEKASRADLEEAQEVAMLKSKVEILAGHRSRDITFSTPLDPVVSLDHTVRLNTQNVVATGKVRTIRDTLDVNTGRATTQITLASSGSGTTGIIVDTPITSVQADVELLATEYNRYVWLPWRLGGRLSSIDYDETWEGYTANYEYDPDDNSRPNPFSPFDAYSSAPDVAAYPQQFVVVTPDISEGDRTSEIAVEDNLIEVNIPIDELQEVA